MPPVRCFLVVGLLSGTIFVFVTPPFQVPDENTHFYRAYALSEGRLFAANVDGRTGDFLPASLQSLVELFYDVPGRPERRIAPGAMAKARELELEPDTRAFLDFPNTAVYTPLPYIPQAVAIRLGRIVTPRPLYLLYMARLFVLATAAALVAGSLRLLPSYPWLFVLLALSPTISFLRASASADALVLAIVLLFVATVTRLSFAAKQVARREVAWIVAASAGLCLTKMPYLPLLFMTCLIPARILGKRRRPVLLLVVATAAAAAAIAALFASSVEAPLRMDAAVDSTAQVRSAIEEPWRFFGIVAADYARHSPRYVAEAIGRLGWLDTYLPNLLLGAFLAVAMLVLALDTNDSIVVESWQRGVLAAIVATTLVLISASQYAIWTPYRADYIEGTQGRHFHPLVFVLPWIVYSRRWARAAESRWLGGLVVGFTVLSLLVAITVLIDRYYSG